MLGIGHSQSETAVNCQREDETSDETERNTANMAVCRQLVYRESVTPVSILTANINIGDP